MANLLGEVPRVRGAVLGVHVAVVVALRVRLAVPTSTPRSRSTKGQFNSRQFDFVCLSARTMHPHGVMERTCGYANEIKKITRRLFYRRLFSTYSRPAPPTTPLLSSRPPPISLFRSATIASQLSVTNRYLQAQAAPHHQARAPTHAREHTHTVSELCTAVARDFRVPSRYRGRRGVLAPCTGTRAKTRLCVVEQGARFPGVVLRQCAGVSTHPALTFRLT